jgi:hypothetical protein
MSIVLGRSLAAVVYVLATLSWAGAMVLGRLLFCEGGDCTTNELHRMDLSVVLGFVGLAVAAATLLGGVFRRWLGLTLLCCHIIVFDINLGIFWGLADSPWVFIPLSALAVAAGYVAVGGPGILPGRRSDLRR